MGILEAFLKFTPQCLNTDVSKPAGGKSMTYKIKTGWRGVTWVADALRVHTYHAMFHHVGE